MADAAAASRPSLYARFKSAVKAIKRDLLAVFYATQDPRVGW
jgi:hypothetical protein